MARFILTTYHGGFECSCDFYIPIEAESKEHIMAYFIKSIKASWDDKYGCLPNEFILLGDEAVKVLGYREFGFDTINFLSSDFIVSDEFASRPKIEKKEDLDCMIESDFVFEIQTLDEWFEENKLTVEKD